MLGPSLRKQFDVKLIVTIIEKLRVPPPHPPPLDFVHLLNVYKWAFVLVGFCPSGLLS